MWLHSRPSCCLYLCLESRFLCNRLACCLCCCQNPGRIAEHQSSQGPGICPTNARATCLCSGFLRVCFCMCVGACFSEDGCCGRDWWLGAVRCNACMLLHSLVFLPGSKDTLVLKGRVCA